jgi:predicted  nucleic acid-binding Zn-ribbon protein
MPHQCVRCNTFYEDGSDAIIKGCTCGAKLFFYVKKEKYDKLKAAQEAPAVTLTPEAKHELEEDVYEMIGHTPDEPVVLDLEAIKVMTPGKYELDLVHLFKGDPLIFKLADGKYVIDVPETFERLRKKQ